MGHQRVSMKSGLEGRNNAEARDLPDLDLQVSMKSGLEGRNNHDVDPAPRLARKLSQ